MALGHRVKSRALPLGLGWRSILTKQAIEQTSDSQPVETDGNLSQRELDAAMTGTPDLGALSEKSPVSEAIPSDKVLQSLSFAATDFTEHGVAEPVHKEPSASSEQPATDSDEIEPYVKRLAEGLARAIASGLSELEDNRATENDELRQLVDRLGDRLSENSFRFAKIERELKVLSDEIQLTRSSAESLRLEFDAAQEDECASAAGADSINELRSHVGTLAESVRATFQRLEEHTGALQAIRKAPGHSKTSQGQPAETAEDVSEHLL